MIDPPADVVTLSPNGVDLAIRYGRRGWPDLDALPRLSRLAEFGDWEATSWLQKQGVKAHAGGMLRVPGNLMQDGGRDGQGIAITVRRSNYSWHGSRKGADPLTWSDHKAAYIARLEPAARQISSFTGHAEKVGVVTLRLSDHFAQGAVESSHFSQRSLD